MQPFVVPFSNLCDNGWQCRSTNVLLLYNNWFIYFLYYYTFEITSDWNKDRFSGNMETFIAESQFTSYKRKKEKKKQVNIILYLFWLVLKETCTEKTWKHPIPNIRSSFLNAAISQVHVDTKRLLEIRSKKDEKRWKIYLLRKKQTKKKHGNCFWYSVI